MNNKINLIVAIDKKFGIGKNGDLPWHLSGDLKHFKDITTKTISLEKKNAVIMGRKTWESLLDRFKPLPNRINIVLSRNKDLFLPEGVFRGGNLTEVIDLINNRLSNDVETSFIIGGAEIFDLACAELPAGSRIYVTHIMDDFDCDTFFTDILSKCEKISESPPLKEGNTAYFFAEYVSS